MTADECLTSHPLDCYCGVSREVKEQLIADINADDSKVW